MVVPSVDYTEVQKSISTYNIEDMYREVNRLKELTAHIPVAARKESGGFEKAYRNLSDQGPNRGPKSAFFDPLSLQYAMGYKDRRYSLTYDVLKRCASQLSIVAAIINTRVAQIASFAAPYRTTKSLGFMVKHKDPEHMTTKSEREFIKHLEAFISDCGEPGRKNPYSRTARDDFESFIKKIVRDTLTYDSLTFEVVPRNNGIPFEFLAVDASTIRIASTDRDSGIGFSYHARNPTAPLTGRFAALYENKQYGALRGGGHGQTEPVTDHDVQYVQIVNGQIENVYSEDELAFGIRNPRTDIYINGYGYGEIEQLITIVTSLLFSEEYNKKYFTQGSHPKGLLNFKGDNWTPDQLEAFRRQWISSVAGIENVWKTPITQSEGVEWTNLQMTNKDMEFSGWIEYLIKIIAAVFLIDPAEINFDLHGGVQQTPLFESSQEWKLKASRDRGLKPLLRFIAKLINKHIIDLIDDHFCCVPGTGVAQPNGVYKPIEEVQVGDVVWTHKNKYGVVTSVGSREVDEEIYRVIPRKQGLKPFEVTGEHPIWVLELNKKYPGVEFIDVDSILTLRIKAKDKEGLPLKFVKASQLEPGRHWLALAQPELPCGDIDVDLLKYATSDEFDEEHSRNFVNLGAWYRHRGYSYDRVAKELGCAPQTVCNAVRSGQCRTVLQKAICLRVIQLEQELQSIPKLARFIKLDEKLAWVLGWFVAEGSFSNSGFLFSLCANTDPVGELRTFFDKLGVPTSVHKHKGREHVVDLIIYSKTLRKFFQECGSGASNKKIPDVILSSSKSVKLAFIKALCDGDGALSGVGGAFHTIMVSSKILLTQLQFMLASFGILSPVLFRPAKKTWYKKEKRYINTGDIYVININKRCLDNVLDDNSDNGMVKYRCWDGHFIVPIDEIQKFHYKGPVYNFSVDGDESYVIDSLVVVHNCFEFVGLDELTEQEKHEMLKEQIASYMTLNEARRSLDLPDIPLGDVPINPAYVQLLQLYNQNVQQQQQMAQQQQQQQQQQQMAAQQMPPGAPGTEQQPPPGALGVEPGAEGVPGQAMAPGQPGQVEVPPGQGPVPGEQPSGSKYTANFGKSMREITVTFNDWIDQKRNMKHE